MSHDAAVWLVLASALLAANLPFLNDRWLAVIPRAQPKTLGMRLVELIALYLAVGGLGLALEESAGQIHAQGWEFYVTTATLFLTLAFPGFVYRYLLKRR
jgi:hypothetical protein